MHAQKLFMDKISLKITTSSTYCHKYADFTNDTVSFARFAWS